MPSHLFHYLLKKQSSMEKSVLGTLSNTRHTAGKKEQLQISLANKMCFEHF